MTSSACFYSVSKLVGGFNPSEKYESKWKFSQIRVKIKNIWNHYLENHSKINLDDKRLICSKFCLPLWVWKLDLSLAFSSQAESQGILECGLQTSRICFINESSMNKSVEKKQPNNSDIQWLQMIHSDLWHQFLASKRFASLQAWLDEWLCASPTGPICDPVDGSLYAWQGWSIESC